MRGRSWPCSRTGLGGRLCREGPGTRGRDGAAGEPRGVGLCGAVGDGLGLGPTETSTLLPRRDRGLSATRAPTPPEPLVGAAGGEARGRGTGTGLAPGEQGGRVGAVGRLLGVWPGPDEDEDEDGEGQS